MDTNPKKFFRQSDRSTPTTQLEVPWELRDVIVIVSTAAGMSIKEWVRVHLLPLTKQAAATQLAAISDVSLFHAFGLYEEAQRRAERDAFIEKEKSKKVSKKREKQREWRANLREVGSEPLRYRLRRTAAEQAAIRQRKLTSGSE